MNGDVEIGSIADIFGDMFSEEKKRSERLERMANNHDQLLDAAIAVSAWADERRQANTPSIVRLREAIARVKADWN